MNRRYWRAVLAAGVLAAVCGGAGAQPALAAGGTKDAAVATAPNFKPGQRWTFRRVDLWRNAVTERFREEMQFPDAGRWLVRWTILDSDDAARRGSVTGEILDPASQGFADKRITQGRHEPLRFPLEVGKRWNFGYTFAGKGGRDLRIEQQAVVAGWETVSVPAGRFRALKVVHKGRYATRDPMFNWTGDIEETYWYAPAAQRVVQMEYRDTQYGGNTWDHWRDELVDLKL